MDDGPAGVRAAHRASPTFMQPESRGSFTPPDEPLPGNALEGAGRQVVAAGHRWFALWTRSRAEKSVNDQLLRKGIETFLPTVNRWSRWKDRRKLIAWPLFPGYCFARFDPSDSLAVLTCTGVVSIVSFEGVPAPIPDSEIAAIQTLVASELKFDACPLLHEGDDVEVVHGPLKGVVGRLVRKGPRTTLVLSITMINRAVSVSIDAADVRGA